MFYFSNKFQVIAEAEIPLPTLWVAIQVALSSMQSLTQSFKIKKPVLSVISEILVISID